MTMILTNSASTAAANAATSIFQSSNIMPGFLAVGGAFLAQTLSNRLVANSVRLRLLKQQHDSIGAMTPFNPITKTKGLLASEIKGKRAALHQSIPFSLVTLLIGQLAVRLHPTTNWLQYAPSALALAADYAFNVGFNALDNIQDEVEALGKPRKREMALLALMTGTSLIVLLRSNKFYVMKAISVLFGTVMAKTDDTPVWKAFGLAAFVAISFAMMAQPSLPGPSWNLVKGFIVAFCAKSFLYEQLTAKENKWNAPSWLVQSASSGILLHGLLSVLTLAGVFPVAWLVRELGMHTAYFAHKIQQHTINYNLLSQHEQRQQQQETTPVFTTTYMIKKPVVPWMSNMTEAVGVAP